MQPHLDTKARKSLFDSYQFRQARVIILTSCFLGLLYPVFGDGFKNIVPYINGFIIGLLGGITICIVELILFKRRRKKTAFLTLVAMKSITYTSILTLLVFVVILVSRSIQWGQTLRGTVESENFQHFIYYEDFLIIIIYALALVSVIIFTQEMSRKMGQGVLFNFITGKYFKPKREHRIFMFLDLNASVSKAEALGDLEYHNLLNDFFTDITESILKANGKIYQYVGDEIVVSWPVRKTTRTEDCLNAFFDCIRKIESSRGYYLINYGFVPSFKAAFHCGEVICGEIGEIKSDIVFHGDVMNTTARMERLCTELKETVLVSKILLDTFPPFMRKNFRSVGKVKLRGKEKEMDIFGWQGSENNQEETNLFVSKTG